MNDMEYAGMMTEFWKLKVMECKGNEGIGPMARFLNITSVNVAEF
jgi:hypothetical protein